MHQRNFRHGRVHASSFWIFAVACPFVLGATTGCGEAEPSGDSEPPDDGSFDPDGCAEGTAEGTTHCDGKCVTLETDGAHCGSCGNACTDSASCVDGECRDDATECVGEDCPCPAEEERCGEKCVDVDADEANCGACGTSCSDGETCVDGSCGCASGLTDCSGACVDLLSDDTHCGNCGTSCEGLESCSEGVCFFDAGDDCSDAARGVSITRVSLYQVVEAQLHAAGATVPVEQRAVDIIQGKDAVVRVHVDLTESSAREVSARVFLKNGSDSPEVFFDKKEVSADTLQSDWASSLNVRIPAAKIQADTEYFVELVRCDESATGAEGLTRIPASGSTPLDARRTGSIRVAFLPVVFNEIVPDTSDAKLAQYTAEVMKRYGTTDVITQVLPQIVLPPSEEPGADMNAMLDLVYNQRVTDEPPDDVYYYGLVGASVNWAGLAVISTQPADRAAVGLTDNFFAFAHELAHNHGLRHAPCGDPDAVDVGYPYANGVTSVWGFDSRLSELQGPELYDFMSYCGPTWVSDYNYNLLSDQIAAVNTSALSRRHGSPETWETLRVGPHGARWVASRPMNDFPADHRVAAVVSDALGHALATVTAYKFEISEEAGYFLAVPPRQPGWATIGLSGDVQLEYR